jgi:hypothetical protein
LKLILNIFLAFIARILLYVLSAPLVILSALTALAGGYSVNYWRTVAIVLDIVGCVIGGPVWNKILLKSDSEVRFGGIITMSFVLAHNYEAGNLTSFGNAICKFLEFVDPGHLQAARTPTYLLTYYMNWK